MKDKLIVKLKQYILDMKETADTLTIDVSDEKKNTVISDLIIPFMQLTETANVDDLVKVLNEIVNGKVESAEHSELLSKIVDVMLEGNDNTKIEEELSNLVTNAYAVLNKFNELKGVKIVDKDNKETGTAFDSFGAEIIAFMNTDVDVNINIQKNEAGEPDPNAAPADGEEVDAEGGGDAILITASTDEVDETPQADVNKIELKNLLEAALTAGTSGAEEAISETFALVRSLEKKGDWQQPHHVLKNNAVVLNTNGLKTAALFLLKPASSKNLSPEDKTIVAKHLLKHYQEIDMAAPAKLSNMSEGKESVIMINVQEDEMKEFGQIFDIGVEDVAVYVGLMESLLTDLVNSGVLNIESDNKDIDESVVSVKLDKSQTEELIKYFDILSTDVTHILNSEFSELSYKKTDQDLNNSYSEAETKIAGLLEQVEELEQAISERNEEVANLSAAHENVNLDQSKFEAIINFVNSIENVDETLVQFINNVVDAEDGKQIDYLLKLGGTFMRQVKQPTRFKKVSMLNNANSQDMNTLHNLIDHVDKKESTMLSGQVNKLVDEISSLFD